MIGVVWWGVEVGHNKEIILNNSAIILPLRIKGGIKKGSRRESCHIHVACNMQRAVQSVHALDKSRIESTHVAACNNTHLKRKLIAGATFPFADEATTAFQDSARHALPEMRHICL